MKQGSGNSASGGQKREPIVHAINPKAVEQLGTSQFKSSEKFSAGRGFTAPAPAGKTIHHSGSQGRHK